MQKKQQLDFLTGLRGIAAYSVLIAHGMSAAFFFNGGNTLQPCAARLAYFGMSLFFILSGFVIAYNYADQIQYKTLVTGIYDFLIARFARLYPLYILVILFSLHMLTNNCFVDKPEAVFFYASLTQSWVNMQNVIFEPTWSISTEMFFYATFIFMAPFLRYIRKPRITLALFVTLTFFFITKVMLIQQHVTGISRADGWSIYYSPFIRVFEFISGVLIAKIYMDNPTVIKQSPTKIINILFYLSVMWCAVIIIIGVMNNVHLSKLLSNYIYAPAITLFILLNLRYDSFFSRMLSNKFFVFIGEISFSVYLLQFWIITALGASFVYSGHGVIGYVNGLIKIGVIMVLTTMIGYGSFHLYEKPARKWLLNILRRKPKAVEVLVADTGLPA